jgi:hypothetical protein
MARRMLTLLLVLALSAVALPAHAEVERVRFQGGFAIGVWENTQAGTFAVAEVFQDVDYLILILEREIRDAQGNVIGDSQLVADANLAPYGTFTIDRQHLSRATLSVAGVPASLCESDLEGNFTCTDAEMSANVTWSGHGKISRSSSTFHDAFHEGGFTSVTNVRSVGSERRAGATGTINGLVLPSEDLTRGTLAYSSFGRVSIHICHDC